MSKKQKNNERKIAWNKWKHVEMKDRQKKLKRKSFKIIRRRSMKWKNNTRKEKMKERQGKCKLEKKWEKQNRNMTIGKIKKN